MWAVKKERKYKKDENGRLQHGVFPDGHPTNIEPRTTELNFCYRTTALVEFVFAYIFFLKTKSNKSLAPFSPCVTIPHDTHWFSSEHRSLALSDGLRSWMRGDCMGIRFLFCVCRFILSVRSDRFFCIRAAVSTTCHEAFETHRRKLIEEKYLVPWALATANCEILWSTCFRYTKKLYLQMLLT